MDNGGESWWRYSKYFDRASGEQLCFAAEVGHQCLQPLGVSAGWVKAVKKAATIVGVEVLLVFYVCCNAEIFFKKAKFSFLWHHLDIFDCWMQLPLPDQKSRQNLLLGAGERGILCIKFQFWTLYRVHQERWTLFPSILGDEGHIFLQWQKLRNTDYLSTSCHKDRKSSKKSAG